jgi:phosphoribosylamine--glycine ligase
VKEGISIILRHDLIRGKNVMNVMVVGGGGREHAIIKKIKENKSIEKIYALPGNGGISEDAVCIDIDAKNIDEIVKFAKNNNVDYAVISTDDPLVMGAVDKLSDLGIPCFGPNSKAAVIEGSKVFSKKFMKKYNIPTAKYEVFENYKSALEYLKNSKYPTVIKADGLALGKGVFIAKDYAEAAEAIYLVMQDKIFGESGNKIVIEEYLCGPEVSILSFTDGKTIIPMISSMDHKKAQDGDKGPNTGGMGAIAPNPYYTEKIAKICMEKIFRPTIEGMNAEKREFKGCLYFGLMITDQGPKVIEYNCRFGDPETQTILPLLDLDLFCIMKATTNQTLSQLKIKFKDKYSCCVVLSSKGYPQKYETGFEIQIPSDIKKDINIAGAKKKDNALITSGGRVLSITNVDNSLEAAIRGAYEKASKVYFENKYYRKDIGSSALKYS